MRHAEGELRVLGMSAQWPDRSSQLSVPSGRIPAPVGLVRVSGGGTLIVMWSVDGNPLTSEIREVKRAGIERFQLDSPLPTMGYHSVTFDLLYPASTGPAATPSPPIVYSVAGATAPPTPLATPIR